MLLSIILLTGCGVDYINVNNPLSEEEIISQFKKQIYEETGDNVDVEIILKKKLKVCTEWLDGCIYYQKVNNGHSYTLKITNKKDNIIANGKYSDGYILYDEIYDGKKVVSDSYYSNYSDQKKLSLVKKEFINTLNDNNDKYYIYKNIIDTYNFNIYINSSNYDDINNLITKLDDILAKYKLSSYHLYIYKDESVFNNTNFKLFNSTKVDGDYYSRIENTIKQFTGKEVIEIGKSKKFNYDLFISSEYDKDYNYTIYVYNPITKLQIFGVK